MAKQFKTQKSAFWQALILALILFNIGVFLGYMLEKNRIQRVDELYAMSELNMLDLRAQADSYEFNISCNDAAAELLNFADKIFGEAKILQNYEDASRLTDALILRHKKYDLLRTQIWINSINLKSKCKPGFHNVIYIYNYNNGDVDIETKARQSVFSRALGNLKEKYGSKVLLLSIAGDNNFSSMNLLKGMYNITEMPAILIDERYTIKDVAGLETMGKYIT